MLLDDRLIEDAKPRTKPYKMFDGGGLHILINPNGSKYWRLKFHFGGKENRISFGVYPAVSLDQARTSREETHRLLRAGINPSHARQTEKEARKSEEVRAHFSARVKDELRFLRVSVLADQSIELRLGRISLTLTEPGVRHLQHLLSRIPKRKG